jgi:putative phosphoribosyl transferase
LPVEQQPEKEAAMFVTTKHERPVRIPSGSHCLHGILRVPHHARGVVAFAHGSGSGRFSPRNQYVARELERGGLATLLLDLLEEKESENRENVFDMELLATRLLSAAEWLAKQPETGSLPLGYFGASTGAGAALIAAARNPARVHAVVSRGGRPDLADHQLPSVEAPTLLLVGADDEVVIGLNKQAFRRLRCRRQLIIIPGASHLFEEPGTLEEVAQLAREWFLHYLNEKPEAKTSRPALGERFPRSDMDEQC